MTMNTQEKGATEARNIKKKLKKEKKNTHNKHYMQLNSPSEIVLNENKRFAQHVCNGSRIPIIIKFIRERQRQANT